MQYSHILRCSITRAGYYDLQLRLACGVCGSWKYNHIINVAHVNYSEIRYSLTHNNIIRRVFHQELTQ